MYVYIAVALVLMYYAYTLLDLQSGRVLSFIVATAPIWAPLASFSLFYAFWMLFVRKDFDLKQGRVTLEIKLPEEIMKSPEAMELVLVGMYQIASPDNHVQTYWDGKHPPTFGLEIVSRGGDVRFYINTPRKKFKNLIESQLYAQYPGIEVHELELDYTAEIPWDPEKYFYFSFHYGLREVDPRPIKTYYDYGLHMMPKEEEKTDPITVTLETLGALKPGENMWIQLLITAHKKLEFKTGSLKPKSDWKDDVRAEIKKIIDEAKERSEQNTGVLQLTEGEKDIIRGMERSMAKYAFETNFRGMYVAEIDAMNPGERLGTLAGIFRQFDDVSRNKLGVIWRTDTNWPWWQDRGSKNTTEWKKAEFYDYKKRAFNHRRYEEDKYTFIMTTEELATLYHFPGRVALTPTLGRIPSTRGEAPPNLPTG